MIVPTISPASVSGRAMNSGSVAMLPMSALSAAFGVYGAVTSTP